jgi:hypothetical protein
MTDTIDDVAADATGQEPTVPPSSTTNRSFGV